MALRAHEDDLSAKLSQGTATVGDVIAHAQEHIVNQPVKHGMYVTEPVKLLLEIIDRLESGEDVHQHDKIADIRLR